MKSKLPFIIVGAVLVLALISGFWFYRSRKPSIVLNTKAGAPGAQPPQVRDVRSVFARQATIMGLDPKRLRSDMDSAEVQQRIGADQQRGQSLGVVGTPTFFLNGRLVAPEELEHLRELIDAALKQ